MKLQKNSNSINIEDTPWSLLVLLWGSGLFACILIFVSKNLASVLMLLVLVLASSILLITAIKISVKSEWHFDFIKKEMNWKRRGPFHYRFGNIQFSDIKKIIIQADSGIAPDSQRYRLALQNTQGILPFTPYYHRGEPDLDALILTADQINTKLGTDVFRKDDVIIDLLSRGRKSEAIMQASLLYGKPRKESEVYVNGLSKINR